MYSQKETYFLIPITGILLIIVSMITFILLTSPSSSSKQQSASISPTPTPIDSYTQAKKKELVEQKAQETLLGKVKHRKQLSEKDLLAKKNILSHLTSTNQGGILYQSLHVIVSYDSSLDIFQAIILTTPIDQAKKEASVWLQKQGLSQEGICNSPVAFFLNPELATMIQSTNTPFSPLAPGCE